MAQSFYQPVCNVASDVLKHELMSRDGDRTAMFLLADRVVGGQLEPMLRRWRAAGVSLRSIQVLLEDELGVKPALETVRRWLRDLDANGDEETAA